MKLSHEMLSRITDNIMPATRQLQNRPFKPVYPIQIRNITGFVKYRDRKKFCQDMKKIYSAPNEKAGLTALDGFEKNGATNTVMP